MQLSKTTYMRLGVCLLLSLSCIFVGDTPSAAPSFSASLKFQRDKYGTPGEPIDLGLSVLWCNKNIGAESPSNAGLYFGFGDIDGTNTSTSYSNYISQDILGTDKDPAYVFWGAGWRMPSKREVEELCERCDWKWTKQNGVEGYKVIGRGGNSIFLPVTGFRSDSTFFYQKSRGYYWAGEVNEFNPNYGTAIFFYKGDHSVIDYRKIYGFTIRPVCESVF